MCAENTWPQRQKKTNKSFFLFFTSTIFVKKKSPTTSDTKRKKGKNKKRCCRPIFVFFLPIYFCFYFSLLSLSLFSVARRGLYFFSKSVQWIFLYLFNIFKWVLQQSTGSQWFIQFSTDSILKLSVCMNHFLMWLVRGRCLDIAFHVRLTQEQFKNIERIVHCV